MKSNDDLDKELQEIERSTPQSQMKTQLARLKLKLFQLGINSTSSDYETYKNIEARIKELEGNV